jgi:hypothetical protein
MGAFLFELVDDAKQMANRSRKTINAYDNQRIAWLNLFQEVRQHRAILVSTRGVLLFNSLASCRPQLTELWISPLFFRRYAGVASQPTPSACFCFRNHVQPTPELKFAAFAEYKYTSKASFVKVSILAKPTKPPPPYRVGRFSDTEQH